MDKNYDFDAVEKKWQRIWEERDFYKTKVDSNKDKSYVLEMFPYPSGKLHMGNMRCYIVGDAIARYYMMSGKNVIHPMGWDAFGLPAENAAVASGTSPADWTQNNIAYMRDQMKRLGFSYDWDLEVSTCDESYYKWGQWLFLQMYEAGLAYRKESLVNWCSSCNTSLANEQVVSGKCWRCNESVTKRELEQWHLKITDYAEELLKCCDELNGWPERVVTMQREWIGRSEGVSINFSIQGATEKVIEVFTTRPETIFGVTYLSLAPEHPMSAELAVGTDHEEEVKSFIDSTILQSRAERSSSSLNGVFTGRYAVNPLDKKVIPIWIANFVLSDYGTGAVMSVPAHDQRDFDFAEKFSLSVRVVLDPIGDDLGWYYNHKVEWKPYTGDCECILVNSDKFSGLRDKTAATEIVHCLEKAGVGKKTVNYKLKDWCISRQRYWGTPIPVLYCDKCGLVPVSEKDLPVNLVDLDLLDWKAGELLSSTDVFTYLDCPICGDSAKLETDTMDTFVDSSWYFMRYLSPNYSLSAIDSLKASYWMPVDYYIGGIEHAVLHLLYARFITKVIRDLGLIKKKIDEPFVNLVAQGMVTKDGKKMSKSFGNVVDPDDQVKKYGADATRLSMLSSAPTEKDLEWIDKSPIGSHRFLCSLWELVYKDRGPISIMDIGGLSGYDVKGKALKLRRLTHSTIRQVNEEFNGRLHFNVCISKIMSLVATARSFTFPSDFSAERFIGLRVLKEAIEAALKLLHPFVPHITEELWSLIGHVSRLKDIKAVYDPNLVKLDDSTIIVQIDGKLRSRVSLPVGSTLDSVIAAAKTDAKVQKYIGSGENIVRTIFIPDRLINFVTEVKE
ncbi:MAG: leucine--tRNA ligase [bacterium]|nr:leucine--tRNA ligase [bacterium]